MEGTLGGMGRGGTPAHPGETSLERVPAGTLPVPVSGRLFRPYKNLSPDFLRLVPDLLPAKAV
jgi:hypothetical protein